MQYKFLKFLSKNLENNVRQVFITTHSPNVTAAIPLNTIIVLTKDAIQNTLISYPGKMFDDASASKKYVERFLDVTKADMFFAKKLIFVEGLAEQLLIPAFAKKMGYDLSDYHVSIININGRYANHFFKMFDIRNQFALYKKIAYITDKDPTRKERNVKDAKYKACCPILLNVDQDKYIYKKTSNPSIEEKYSENISVFSQDGGSTFEYQLVFENPTCEELITKSVSNKTELRQMMNAMDKKNGEFLNILKDGNFKRELENLQEKTSLDALGKFKEHVLAQRYLQSISKGVVAQELMEALDEDANVEYNIPDYIQRAIKWICQ